ncbi:transposase family protein [Streptomyces rubradiris]|uniref:transposase family protein n=1 Tax=Streptomyces rubradiris TaxID=285531 RepID=UPI0019414DA1
MIREDQAGPRGRGPSCLLWRPAPTPRRVDRRTRATLGSALRVRAARAAPGRPPTAGRGRAEVRTGPRRPAAGHPGSPAHRPHPRGPRRGVRGGLLHSRPRHQRNPPAPGGAGIRHPRPVRPATAHPGGRFRLRRRRELHPAHDGTGTKVRRSRAHRLGRRAFVSGKRRQNATKATKISDHQARPLWSGAMRPGRMHDQTCVRTEGIAGQFRLQPSVKAEADEGYRGLAASSPTRSVP